MTTDSETSPHPPQPKAAPAPPLPPPISPAEQAMLDGLSDRMRPLAIEAHRRIVERATAAGGLIVRVVRGSATDADQLAIWAVGRQLIAGRNPMDPKSWRTVDPGLTRTRAFPGLTAHRGPDGSKREGGDAVDIALLDAKSKAWLRGGDPQRADPRWSIIRDVADELGLVWGGRFKVRNARGELEPFYDAAHLQHAAWRAAR